MKMAALQSMENAGLAVSVPTLLPCVITQVWRSRDLPVMVCRRIEGVRLHLLGTTSHARHSPPRMGNPRTPCHARAPLLEPPGVAGGKWRGRVIARAEHCAGPTHPCPARPDEGP